MLQVSNRISLLTLQGVVESRVLEDGNFQNYMLVLLSRRSRLHPGMRYIARGLNSLASPGNEIECEQVSAPPHHCQTLTPSHT